MLKLAHLTYEKHTSTHGTYLEDLLNELSSLESSHPKFIQFTSFTDIVFIGGDGFSFLFYYNLSQHPKLLELFKDKAFGYMPGGSYCAQACDVKGRIENYACTNIIRGVTSKR